MSLRRFAPLFLALVAFACGGAQNDARVPPPTSVDVPPVASAEGALAPLSAGEKTSGTTWSDAEAPVPVTSKDPWTGKRDALVTVVMFTDLQCPFCTRVRPTLAELRRAYGDDLRIVWKNLPLPFHQHAEQAAEAAYGVYTMKGNAGFWTFVELAFDHQSALGRDDLVGYARTAGVDNVALFESQLDAHGWDGKVHEDSELAHRLGLSGTPSFFINGSLLVGAQPLEKFKEVVDAELAKARALVGSGTPRDKVYVAAAKANYQKPADRKDDDDDDDDDAGARADAAVFKVPVGGSPVRGKADALVTMIEFADFQCPFCARVQPTIEALRQKYGNELRVVFKNEPLPFHPRAEPAAELALEARAEKGDAGFWTAHDMLFANSRALDDQDLEGYAKKLGLSVPAVTAAIANHKFKTSIDADQDLADDMRANGTPHFFINGRRLVGAQPQEKFEKLIDEEMTKARALVSAGTPQAKVYEKTIEKGQGAPEPEKKTVALPKSAPSKGAKTAKVVIQEFSDFECPFCGRAEPTVAEIMKSYGTRVRFVWRNLPLPMHPHAPMAAQAAVEAFKQKGDAGFWKMHDLMFANQRDLERQTLDGYAQQIGLDMNKWAQAMDSGANKAAVDADADAANAAGISGTPAFLINGYFVSGAQPYAKFRKIIERALAEAK